ncbi:MAG: hypothetical protein ACRDG8_01415 [Actinomycetota bacterium]
MPKKLSALVAIFAMSSLLLFSAGSAAVAAPPAPGLNDIPVTGSFGEGGTFTGTFDIERFAAQGGEVVAVGDISGVLTDAGGTVIGSVTDVATALPLQSVSCEILDLTLGLLDLDLLGLVVHLDTVHLNITAEQGPGNLLGNLICAVAGLLDNDAPANAIARLLNQLLGLLNRLG